jgi:hypothetical protein
VLSSPDGVESGEEHEALARVGEALGMGDRETVAGSYADLLAERPFGHDPGLRAHA